MASRRRVNMKALLADADLRRELMVSTIQATQAREGIETTREQADRAYYVVTESEKAAFFDLERYRGGRRGEVDQREDAFVRNLADSENASRFDVARRDFSVIDASPLAYREVGILASVVNDHPALGADARIHQGVITRDDPRFLRKYWEVSPRRELRPWVPIHKGGGFCRFYYDTELVIDWAEESQEAMHRLRDTDLYFNEGLTWPLRTQRGFNVRYMPSGCVFSHKGGGILLSERLPVMYVLGVLNSTFAEYIARSLASFGSWEVRILRAIPMPGPESRHAKRVGDLAARIYDLKASWDLGNEISTRFEVPWLLEGVDQKALSERLDQLADRERAEEAQLQSLFVSLNEAVYELYGVSRAWREQVDAAMGDRPPEVLWPEMERKGDDQKRMEHVWRLLSYAVKRVVEADEDGIVPFIAVGGEAPLVDRVRAELDALFPNHDLNQVEVGITNELKRRVKGYRRVETLEEWLRDEYFDYHTSLYQGRPVFWHIASAQGRGEHAFGAVVHYHKFDHDRLAKLRGTYLRDAMAHFRREAGLADQEGRTEDRQEWQAKLEEAEQLDRRLQWVQEGTNGHPAPGDCRIRTPWKSEEQQPKGWRPDLDDGVVVNIAPLQTAGVLRTGGST